MPRCNAPKLVSLLLVPALFGCSGLNTYYREGVTIGQLQKETLACQVEALEKAPVANEIRQSPPIYVRGRQHCTANGCYTSPGYWIDGDIYTVDTNKPLRDRIELQCMADKGYEPVSIPACNLAVQNSAQEAATTVLPRLTANTCVIKIEDGSIQIVQTAK